MVGKSSLLSPQTLMCIPFVLDRLAKIPRNFTTPDSYYGREIYVPSSSPTFLPALSYPCLPLALP